MTGSFRPAVSHLRTLPGCGRKPDQTAIAAFILPANGLNIPGPSLVTESNAPPAGISGQPSARETISTSTPAIHETGRYRPDRKTANSLRQVPASPPYRNTPYRRKTDTSAQDPFPVAATGRQTIRNSPLPLPISRTRKPAKTGTRRAAPHRPGQQRNPPRLSRTIPIGRLACHNGHRTRSTLIFP